MKKILRPKLLLIVGFLFGFPSFNQAQSNAQRNVENITWDEAKPTDKPGDLEIRRVQHGLESANIDWTAVKGWLQKASDAGNPLGECFLANYYLKIGSGYQDRNGDKDVEKGRQELMKACENYERSEKQGVSGMVANLWALLNSYKFFMGDKEIEIIAQWFQSQADHGNSEAAFDLAQLYEYGIGVSKNTEMAKKYFRQSQKADEKYKNLLELFLLESKNKPVTVQGTLKIKGGLWGGPGGELTLTQPTTFLEGMVFTKLFVVDKEITADVVEKRS